MNGFTTCLWFDTQAEERYRRLDDVLRAMPDATESAQPREGTAS